MRLLTLSNHTQDQASAAAGRRHSAYEADIESYKHQIQQRTAKAGALRESATHAWRDRRYVAWVSFQFSRLFHAMSAMPPVPQ